MQERIIVDWQRNESNDVMWWGRWGHLGRRWQKLPKSKPTRGEEKLKRMEGEERKV